jgi:hypothetical protein
MNLKVFGGSDVVPELNSSAQRCLARIFTGDFASLTVHFVMSSGLVLAQHAHPQHSID